MEKPLVRQYVGRAIIRRGNKFLFANKIGEPHWFLPGGRVEPGESIRSAVKRELSEELAAESTVGQFVGCIEHGFSTSSKDYYEVGFFFLVSSDAILDSAVSNEKEMQFKWVSPEGFSKLDIRPPPLVGMLKDLVSGKQHEGSWSSTFEPKE